MNLLKNIISISFICIFSLTLFSQNKLNDYKYISISKQLDLKRKQNQFNINNLLQSHLNNHDFVAFVQGDSISSTLKPCDVLKTSINETGFLTTNITISFKDCYDNIIYTTTEGVSRIKEFKLAYYEAFSKTLKDPNIELHKFTKNTRPKKEINVGKTFVLEFKGTKYTFMETSIKDEFAIIKNFKPMGTLKKQKNSDTYILDAKEISGTGTFDVFGNFTLTRINPVNNTKITDVMPRVK